MSQTHLKELTPSHSKLMPDFSHTELQDLLLDTDPIIQIVILLNLEIYSEKFSIKKKEIQFA